MISWLYIIRPPPPPPPPPPSSRVWWNHQVLTKNNDEERTYSYRKNKYLWFYCSLRGNPWTILKLTPWIRRIYALAQKKIAAAMQAKISDYSTMTSSNVNIFRVTGPLCREFTGPGEFTAQRPVTRNFDISFDLCLNKRLSKQPPGWWFETPLWPLWRQCNVWNVNTWAHFLYINGVDKP